MTIHCTTKVDQNKKWFFSNIAGKSYNWTDSKESAEWAVKVAKWNGDDPNACVSVATPLTCQCS